MKTSLVFYSVKMTRKTTATIAVFIICIGTSFLSPSSSHTKENIDNYYQQQLQSIKSTLLELKDLSQKKSLKTILQQQFYQARLTYKKLAILTEYFNIYETKFLNSPAIDRVEEDHPDDIIKPTGFQAIEQILFSNWTTDAYEQVIALSDQMIMTIVRLEKEIDRANKFNDVLVWDAVRAAIIRITTLGITGVDSPTAQYSLPEATASIEGIKNILLIIQKEKSDNSFSILFDLLTNASKYLSSHNNFNSFDRLHFIAQYINPIYKQLAITRFNIGIAVPDGNNPVNFNADNFFDKNFFNINFYSPDKAYWITPERIELGKKLFSDPILSGTNTRSCSSCHQPEKAFTDGIKTPLAVDNKTFLSRNTPTLWNSALQTRQFMDSRTDILENQLDEVVHNETEMKGSLSNSVAKMKITGNYLTYFKKAYPAEKDPLNNFTIANAISSYVRSLVALNSRFDQYMHGDKTTLTSKEKKGFNLFTGKAKCATCHFIPLFNGLAPPVFTETESEVIGIPAKNTKNDIQLDSDLGKYLFTRSVIHKNSFKTPTLRNIELTAPYMHNGVFNTLKEVVDFYNKGGGKGLHITPVNQTLPFDKLNLSKKEISAIIAFMKTLTDTVYTGKSYSAN